MLGRTTSLVAALWGLLALLAGCGAASEGDELQTARYGNFLFRYPAAEKGNVRALGELCDAVGERVAEDLGAPLPGEIRVWIVTDEEAFRAAWPGSGSPEKWAAAAADPESGIIVMKSPKMLLGSRQTYDAIFLHEVAHVALHRALSAPPDEEDAPWRTPPPGPRRQLNRPPPKIPRWLHEGYAQYLARQWSPNKELLLSRAVLQGDLIPLGLLVRGFPRDEDRARLAYAESADLVHFLIHRYGNPSFHRFLSELGRTGSFGAACRLVFQEGFLEVEKAWRKHLRNRYTWIPLLGSTGTLWFLMTVVFLLAYLRKRMASRRRLREWSDEETL